MVLFRMNSSPFSPGRRGEPPAPDLTRELVRSAFPAPMPDDLSAMTLLDDDEIEASLDAAMARAPDSRAVWLFGYGSLMWRPEIETAEARLAVVAGWHRRFCLWQWRSRGSRERPGLMLALDRGGACKGVAFRVTGADLRAKLRAVWQRELRGNGYRARWMSVQTADGPVPAVTFVINRDCERYAGRLDDAHAADHIATAFGSRGPSAEYLCETVLRCRELGIHDRYLWKLQALVAARLRAVTKSGVS